MVANWKTKARQTCAGGLPHLIGRVTECIAVLPYNFEHDFTARLNLMRRIKKSAQLRLIATL